MTTLTVEACLNNTSSSFSSSSIIPSNVTASALPEDGSGRGGGEEDEHMRELAEQVEYYVLKLFIPIISALGVVGNLLSLVVLTKEKRHRVLSKMEISAHIGLIALAVSDFLLCLTVLLVTTLPFKDLYGPGETLVYFHLVSTGLITMFIITSTWLIVVMAAERYVAVCHPLKARNLILLWRSRTYVIALFVLCPLCTIPVFLESYIEEVRCVNGEVALRVDTVSRESMVLRRFVWAMAFDFIPCAALIFFNTCLIWKIHKAKQLREKMAPLHASMSSARAHSRSGGGGSNVQKFRWDRNNGRSSQPETQIDASGHSKAEKKSFVTRLQKSGGTTTQHNTRLLDRIELSETSVSPQPSYNGAVEDRRGEKQLLCQQDKNGMVTTSSSRQANKCHKDRSVRSQGSTKSRYHDGSNALGSVTATLVAVVLTFLILVSPWELLKFGMQYSSSPVDTHKISIAKTLTNLMQVLNFSFNFVLYCLVNKSFRRTLRAFVCPQSLGQ